MIEKPKTHVYVRGFGGIDNCNYVDHFARDLEPCMKPASDPVHVQERAQDHIPGSAKMVWPAPSVTLTAGGEERKLKDMLRGIIGEWWDAAELYRFVHSEDQGEHRSDAIDNLVVRLAAAFAAPPPAQDADLREIDVLVRKIIDVANQARTRLLVALSAPPPAEQEEK